MEAPTLDDFNIVAKIDFITIGEHRLLPGRRTNALASSLQQHFNGPVELPRRNQEWLTVHDPSVADLQKLIDVFHEAAVQKLEIAVDFVPTSAMPTARLEHVYDWLRHCLTPQRHQWMRKLTRSQYSAADEQRISVRALRPLPERTTFYWSSLRSGCQVRLYIKSHDQAGHVTLTHPVVRMELTLTRGGAQLAQIARVGLLPEFARRLRRYLSPFFSVGKGIKVRPIRRIDRLKTPELRQATIEEEKRAAHTAATLWSRYGSAYAMKHGLGIVPDSRSNRIIEASLKRLGERLVKLHKPEKVAHFEAWLERQHWIDQGYFGVRPVAYRRTNT